MVGYEAGRPEYFATQAAGKDGVNSVTASSNVTQATSRLFLRQFTGVMEWAAARGNEALARANVCEQLAAADIPVGAVSTTGAAHEAMSPALLPSIGVDQRFHPPKAERPSAAGEASCASGGTANELNSKDPMSCALYR